MYQVDDRHFDELVSIALDGIPSQYQEKLKNVAFIVETEPTRERLQELGLPPTMTLLGLYTGVPLPLRNGNNNMLLPDIITLYKNPIQTRAHDEDSLLQQIKDTVWHEVAHYFGLNHLMIDKLEHS